MGGAGVRSENWLAKFFSTEAVVSTLREANMVAVWMRGDADEAK